MKQINADKLARVALYLSILPFVAILLGWFVVKFEFIGDEFERISYWYLAMISVAWLTIAPLILAIIALWKKCRKKWLTSIILLVNGLILVTFTSFFFYY